MDEEFGKELNVWYGYTGVVSSCNFSPCGQFIVSGSWDNTVKIWDVLSGNCIKTLKGHTNDLSSCNFSSCGTLIVSGSRDETIRVWKGFDEEKLVKFAGKIS